MSVKLNFKLERSKFGHISGTNISIGIKNELEKCFTEKGLQFSRAYDPSHKYIKVLLSSEKVVDDIFIHKEYFTSKGFQPNLSMQLRSARTVFCYYTASITSRTHSISCALLEFSKFACISKTNCSSRDLVFLNLVLKIKKKLGLGGFYSY